MNLVLKILKSKITYLLLIVSIGGFYLCRDTEKPQDPRSSLKPTEAIISVNDAPKEQAITTISRDIASVRTASMPEPRVITETIIQQAPQASASGKPSNTQGKVERNTPIVLNIYNKVMEPAPDALDEEIVEPKKPRDPVPPKFAPYGRLVKCELVNTVDSSNLETPIIGLVMEPVFWNGELIIPAGSEVHGIAKTNKIRERITSGDSWNIILPAEDLRPNGAALAVSGVALDCDNPRGDGKTFGITDGSFGLKGYRIKSNDMEEIKLFASTFMGALSAGLQKQVPDGGLLGGTKPNNSVRDATLGGITAIMARFAERIEKEIEENGFYTRVPAGKQFYLYVQQNINPNDWDMAKSLKKQLAPDASDSEDPDSFLAEKLTSIKDYFTEKHL